MAPCHPFSCSTSWLSLTFSNKRLPSVTLSQGFVSVFELKMVRHPLQSCYWTLLAVSLQTKHFSVYYLLIVFFLGGNLIVISFCAKRVIMLISLNMYFLKLFILCPFAFYLVLFSCDSKIIYLDYAMGSHGGNRYAVNGRRLFLLTHYWRKWQEINNGVIFKMCSHSSIMDVSLNTCTSCLGVIKLLK